MRKLEFAPDTTKVSLSELRKLGRVVIIRNGLEIIIDIPEYNSYRGIFAAGSAPWTSTELDATNDKIYIFKSSIQIISTLNQGKCLDEFLYKPNSISKQDQIIKWLDDYKYVGATASTNTNIRRHLKNYNCLKLYKKVSSFNKHGELQLTNIFNSDGSMDYINFVGTHDEYEFFNWLNGD